MLLLLVLTVCVFVPPLRSTRLAVQLKVLKCSDDAPCKQRKKSGRYSHVVPYWQPYWANYVSTCPAAFDSHTKSSETTKNSSWIDAVKNIGSRCCSPQLDQSCRITLCAFTQQMHLLCFLSLPLFQCILWCVISQSPNSYVCFLHNPLLHILSHRAKEAVWLSANWR